MCIFLMILEVEHLFNYLLAIPISLLEKIYASPLPIFNERLAFCFTIVAIELYEFLTYFDVLIPYQIGCLQILFPILFHVFSFYSLFLFAGQKLLA